MHAYPSMAFCLNNKQVFILSQDTGPCVPKPIIKLPRNWAVDGRHLPPSQTLGDGNRHLHLYTDVRSTGEFFCFAYARIYVNMILIPPISILLAMLDGSSETDTSLSSIFT